MTEKPTYEDLERRVRELEQAEFSENKQKEISGGRSNGKKAMTCS